MTPLAMPITTMLPRIALGTLHMITVNEAMRYLCDEVFPSPCQKRNELRGAVDRRNEHGRRTVLQ